MRENTGCLSVSELNHIIQAKLEGDEFLSFFSLQGEVSNFKLYPSGHAYFALKDADSLISAVMWRSHAERLSFLPQNGDKVIVKGKIGVFPAKGIYQVSCFTMEKDGQGDLLKRLRELAEKLRKEGLFEESRKKKIPRFPRKIAVIAGKNSAGMRDIEVNLAKRWPLCEVEKFPSLVQGELAKADLLLHLKEAIASNPDTIIIGRGGGSSEDLGAFNDEALVRAVASCPIPVIAAVGHEVDVTLIDLVADLRCSTPTGAAVAATPDQNEVRQRLDQIGDELDAKVRQEIALKKEQLLLLSNKPYFSDPKRLYALSLDRIRQLKARLEGKVRSEIKLGSSMLESTSKSLDSRVLALLEAKKARLLALSGKMSALNPDAVLSRGFSLTTDESGTPISSAMGLSKGEKIKTKFSDGIILSEVLGKE